MSQSVLWDLQRRFFRRQAVLAWSAGTVPQYITSNPILAAAYARIVHGWLRDGLSGAAPALDRGQPVHILDLGAGSGRFGYRFLKLFHQLEEGAAGSGLQVRYVMTDRVMRNLEFWRDHPSFQPFVAAGQLDFALFDTEGEQGEIRLLGSGEALPAGGGGNPLVVFANYFFDSIPQDAFVIESGTLQERLVSVGTSRQEPDPDDPALLSRVHLEYEHRRVSGDGYYGEPDLDRVLEEYERRLPDAVLLFPCAALRCIRRLAAIAGGRLLLLSADKGYHREEDLLGREEPARPELRRRAGLTCRSRQFLHRWRPRRRHRQVGAATSPACGRSSRRSVRSRPRSHLGDRRPDARLSGRGQGRAPLGRAGSRAVDLQELRSALPRRSPTSSARCGSTARQPPPRTTWAPAATACGGWKPPSGTSRRR